MNQIFDMKWNINPFKGAENYFNSKWENFFEKLVTTLMEASADICIVSGLVCAILFIFGWKKGKNAPLLAWGIHLIIQILGRVILGV